MDTICSMNEKESKLDFYQARLRILFILYFFSETHSDPEHPSRKTIFETEVRIQKLDFLLRNPDYLAYEILSLIDEGKLHNDEQTKLEIKNIFKDKEPVIRKTEMEKFFFGAYEDLDDIIAFLSAYGFIEFESSKSLNGKIIGKKYYITNFGKEKIQKGILNVPVIKWYSDRCKLIKKYFGSLSGNELKVRQYQIDEYRNTPLNNYIASIEQETKGMYKTIFKEEL
jgi:hypothetical protein